MTRLNSMVLVLVLTIFASPRARASWEVAPGLVGGLRPGSPGGGGAGILQLSWQTTTFAVELRGEAGYFAKPDDAIFGIQAGVRWSPLFLRFGGFSPFLAADFVHQHEADWPGFAASPLSAIAGVCPCIHHRTGVAAGVGAAYRVTKALPLDVIGRLDGTLLIPAPEQPTTYVTATVALGWTF